MKVRWKRLLLVFLLLVVGSGCAMLSNGYRSPNRISNVKKVAVLPFDNISGRKDAGKVVANIFVSELFESGRFKVEEPGNIVQFMLKERVETVRELETLQFFGKRLEVDAIIVGTVEEFDDGFKVGGSQVPVVSIIARMVDTNSGRITWAVYNKRRGDDYTIIFDFGEVRSVTTLAQKVIREMIYTIR